MLPADISTVKTVASNITKALRNMKYDPERGLTHSAALNLAARGFGYRNYNAFMGISASEKRFAKNTLIKHFGSRMQAKGISGEKIAQFASHFEQFVLPELLGSGYSYGTETAPGPDYGFIPLDKIIELGYDLFVYREYGDTGWAYRFLCVLMDEPTAGILYDPDNDELSILVDLDIKRAAADCIAGRDESVVTNVDVALREEPFEHENTPTRMKYYKVGHHAITNGDALKEYYRMYSPEDLDDLFLSSRSIA